MITHVVAHMIKLYGFVNLMPLVDLAVCFPSTVCVMMEYPRERDRERETETHGERERERETARQTDNKREREREHRCCNAFHTPQNT